MNLVLSNHSVIVRTVKKEVPSPLDNLLASTPLRPSENGHIPTLTDLRSKDKKDRKHPSLLPNEYLFSTKGKIEYDKLEISEFCERLS